jgi:hypothetical protein
MTTINPSLTAARSLTRSSFIPWAQMSRAQQEDHLRYAHGFGAYERGGPWQEPGAGWDPLSTWRQSDLDDHHAEDHGEPDRECDNGPIIHVHSKEAYIFVDRESLTVRTRGWLLSAIDQEVWYTHENNDSQPTTFDDYLADVITLLQRVIAGEAGDEGTDELRRLAARTNGPLPFTPRADA